MKKMFLMALLVCGAASVSFGGELSEKCEECIAKQKSVEDCVGDCQKSMRSTQIKTPQANGEYGIIEF